ncbi:MAG TPA: twin-arginine translocation signal domain-containing protein, partial [Bryobacterales bacterium]|nr:twin-arginine translocation signal domain-containing protein [Bryobacterales bacterium]
MDKATTRRNFLRSAGAAAAWAGPGPYAAAAPARPGPNDTIGLGLIGCGARGRKRFIPYYNEQPGVRFTAVCDVNAKYLEEGRR